MEGGSRPGQVSVSGSADLPGRPCQGTKALRRQCRLGLPTKQPCILPANPGTYKLLKVPVDSRVKNQALEAVLSLTAWMASGGRCGGARGHWDLPEELPAKGFDLVVL